MAAAGRVQLRGTGEQPAVGRLDLLPGRGAGHDRDRHHLARRPRGVDRDAERARRVGKGVGRVARGRGGPRRADERVAAAQALRQDERAILLAPEGVLPAEPAGPGVLQHRAEARHDLQRPERVHLEQHQEPRLVERGEDVLADGEGGVGVRDRGRLGPHLDGARHVGPADGLVVLGHAEVEAEAARELQRVDPQLGLAGLDAQPGRARAHDADVLPRPHVAAQPDGRGLDREARDGRQGARLGRRGSCAAKADRRPSGEDRRLARARRMSAL